MHLHFILLEEWNNSAIAVLFALVLIPGLIIWLVLNAILRTIPAAAEFIATKKKQHVFVFALLQLFLFAASLAILFLIVTIYRMTG